MPGHHSTSSFFRLRRLAWIAALGLLSLLFFGYGAAAAQDELPPDPQPPVGLAPSEPQPGTEPAEPLAGIARTAIHGVVRNAATGQPLPRALVRIEGDAVTGALTDGEGRFEITGVPVGPQAVQIIKPGFTDPSSGGIGGPPTVINGASNSEHNVYVASDMPDLAFNLAPTNAIQGQVALSTGDPAQGIAVMLLRRTVQDGRPVWQPVTNVRTNSDGAYRFAGLLDGAYAVFTEPAMDSELPAAFVEPGSDRGVIRAGYPSIFYPDAADLTGASRIQVAGGELAQANLLLSEQPFRLVRAGVLMPGGNASGAQPINVNVNVLDGQGHQLPYSGQYDQATHSAQAFLPDGTYTLQVTAAGPAADIAFNGPRARVRERFRREGSLVGRVEFSVAGHALTHLQIPLTSLRSNTIQVSVIRSGAEQKRDLGYVTGGAQQPPIVVMVSQAGGSVSDGMVTSFGEGSATGPIETSPDIGPGAYWVHTNIPQKTLCEGSFTAGAANLAREPLVLSLSGASAPLTLTLRDDCASLKISLPSTADVEPAGDEPSYTVYVVPDFDSTVDVTPVVLRPSSGGSFILDGLTPGSYHVYTFSSPVQLEYRNPEAMASAASHSQAVTLDPGGSPTLAVEVPAH